MSKLFIEDTTLTAIGDAIREKTGTSDLIAPLDMPSAIGSIEAGGGGGEVEITSWDIASGSTSTTYSHPTAQGTFDKYMDGKSFTINLTANPGYLFYGSEAEDLSKVVVNYNATSGSYNGASFIFSNCDNLKYLPKFNIAENAEKKSIGFKSMFQYCPQIRNIDEELWHNLMSLKDGHTTEQNFPLSSVFEGCKSLRQLPDMTVYDDMITTNTSSNNHFYYRYFMNCYVLDTIEHLPAINTSKTITSNMFQSTFNTCNRLKDIIFATDNGTPYVRNWSNQTIDLNQYVGFTQYLNYITTLNSGITTDKEVKDDATYQALKNDPDWFTTDIAYSRYNHDSAVATINSLPDCSSGSGNTIKFNGRYGSATDGGAISNLTEEEIAVATAKGWTVSLV